MTTASPDETSRVAVPASRVPWRAVRAVVAIAALVPIAWHLRTFVTLMRARLTFPADIEWVEGNMLYHAYRLIHGEYLYGDPARGFATLAYPPLYWATVGFFGRIFGLDYVTGRAVSVACIVGAALILTAVVVRRAPTLRSGVLFGAIALAGIAAGFPATGGSYDVARTDALALFFPALAAAVAGDGRLSIRRGAAVAILLVAALYSKQTNVFFVVWILGFVVARGRRTGVAVAVATLGLSASLLAVLCGLTDGWFWVSLFSSSHHAVRVAMWAEGVGRILTHAPFLLLVPWVVLELSRRGALRPVTAKWTGMLGAGIVASLVPFIKIAGWFNVLLPSIVLAWPVMLLLTQDLIAALPSARARMHARLGTVASAAVLLFALQYDATPYIPSAQRWDQAAQLDALLRSLDGNVVVTTNAFAAIRAGKSSNQPILLAHLEANILGRGVPYVEALKRSDATWVLFTGRPVESSEMSSMPPTYDKVKELPFGFESLGQWDTPTPKTLWRRR